MITSEVVKERIQQEVDKCNLRFGKWEQIKRFELTNDAWSIDAGHLTPTMKMKRSVILKIYSSLVEKIYN
jgi:long-chain acyl-CoA synthetase